MALFVLVGQPLIAWAQYVPPIGIPAPSFGINESHQMYAGRMYGVGGFPYGNAGNGPYSHYIDNTVPCTDTNNPYGTASNPRCSIPSTLPAGSVVEVHGGPYTNNTFSPSGTAALPVFIRGVSATQRFTMRGVNVTVSGTFAIIEHLDLAQGWIALRADQVSGVGSDLALRYSYIHDHPAGTGALVGLTSTRVVAYQNEVARNGGIDRHGFGVDNTTSDVWVLENHSHHHTGDSIQFCHNCNPGPSNVYIGRNEFHDDIENAIDLKATAGPVIISENHIYNYQPSPSSNGDAIRVNDEGLKGEIWIVANRIHDAAVAINPSRATTQGVFVVGNVIWNITEGAIAQDAKEVVNNTLYNVGSGILAGDDVTNNIIVMAAGVAIARRGVVMCSHNLVSGGGTVNSACTDQTNANPLFANAPAGDFRLQAGSPARNSGTVASVYQTFFTKYGRSIAFDVDHRARPQEGSWDIGAFEFIGTTTTVPAAPTNLRIVK